MTIFTDGLRQGPGLGIHELDASLGESLAATAGEAFESLPTVSLVGMDELATAAGGVSPSATIDQPFVNVPLVRMTGESPAIDVSPAADVPMTEARQRVKDAGLDKALHLPNAPSMREPALDIMLSRARARREREATIERGPSGIVPGALGFGTSLLVSAIDPLNVAAAFIPVIGEARYAKLMASAGESMVARAGVRAGVGAASGAVGMAAIEPIEYAARNQEGQDYTFADALRAVMYGAALGGALHAGGGAAADFVRGRRGQPVYPFREGEPFARQPAPGAAEAVRQTALGRTDVPAEGETPLHGLLNENENIVPPQRPDAAPAVNILPVKEERPQSLLEFIAARGGVSEDDPLAADLLQSFGGKNPTIRGYGKLVRPGGRGMDNIREAAVEAGYLEDAGAVHGGVTESTINDVLEAVDRAARGEKVYPAGEDGAMSAAERRAAAEQDSELRARFVDEVMAAFEAELDARGVTSTRRHIKTWALAALIKHEARDPAEAIDLALRNFGMAAEHPMPQPIEAWHGSPHDFERFDIGKIGEGEGAQSYGHGLYFAEEPKVAKEYHRRLAEEEGGVSKAAWDDPELGPQLKEARDEYDGLHERLARAETGAEIADIQFKLDGALRRWEALRAEADANHPSGGVYKVRIHANREHFLDWDKSLNDQSPAVREALRSLGVRGNPTGEEAYQQFIKYRPDRGGAQNSAGMRLADLDKTPEAASALFREAGIVGIKYLDEGSRGVKYWVLRHPEGGTWEYPNEAQARAFLKKNPEYTLEPPQQTRNFVVFDARLIETVEKNGNAVLYALDDLPPRAKEDALRASIAAVTDGAPVRTGEMLAAAAEGNPRMAALSAAARDWPDLPEQAHFAGNGDHGPIVDGLQDRWTEAVEWLSRAQAGDAIGVLRHPDVPGERIDVVWGEPDRAGRLGHGLAHIVQNHPDVIADLPERLARMRRLETTRTGGRIREGRIELESADGYEHATIRTDYDGAEKTWLLTAFDRRSGRGGVTPETPADLMGPGRSPAPPVDNLSGVAPGGNEAAWRDLAQARPEFDDPAVIEASRAADELPAPGSLAREPSARVAAAEKAAADIEAEYRANEAFLPDDLKEKVERDIAALDLEASDRAEVINRGAACLAAAVGDIA